MSTKYVLSDKRANNYLLRQKKLSGKIKWQKVLIVPLVTGLFSIVSNNILSAEINTADHKVEIPKELETALIEQGLVRVIVGLNVEFKPEGELSTPQDVSEQQSRILATQTQLISQIEGVVVLEEKLFSTIPFLSINANRIILNLLTANPLVRTIQLDETTSLSVPNTNNNMEVIQ
jgi:hypothetical protein